MEVGGSPGPRIPGGVDEQDRAVASDGGRAQEPDREIRGSHHESTVALGVAPEDRAVFQIV